MADTLDGRARRGWKAYAVDVAPVLTGVPNTVQHGAPVSLIDPQGRERALYDPQFSPNDLAHDVRTLLAA